MLQRMKALMRLSLVALAFGSPTSAKSADDTVAMTWADGWFAFPKGFAGLPTRTTVKTLREAEALGEGTKKPWPTVVYIHGCKGHGGSTKIAMRVLADAGFVVVAPNSFARPGPPETRNPRQHRRIRGAPIADARRMRLEEIAFGAVAEPKLRWGNCSGGWQKAFHPVEAVA
jgi:poly(3-hydroxybutyrate) depolymerase